MKTLFLSILLITSLSLSAQITKGNWLVGGDIAFSYAEDKNKTNSKTFTMRGSPNTGYFFLNKIALGAKLNYTFNYSKFEAGSSKNESFYVGPFARYYFLEANKPINIFLESSYTFGLMNYDKATEFSAKTGTSIFLNNSVALEISLNYLNSTTNNRYVGDHALLLGFGIQVHLEK